MKRSTALKKVAHKKARKVAKNIEKAIDNSTYHKVFDYKWELY